MEKVVFSKESGVWFSEVTSRQLFIAEFSKRICLQVFDRKLSDETFAYKLDMFKAHLIIRL